MVLERRKCLAGPVLQVGIVTALRITLEQIDGNRLAQRFEAALKSAFNTPHNPLKERPRLRKKAKKKKAKLY